MNDKSQIEIEAEEARRVLDSPAFRRATTIVKAKIIQDFESTNLFQKRKRDEAWRRLKTLRAIESELKRQIDAGYQAERQREAKNRHKKLRGL